MDETSIIQDVETTVETPSEEEQIGSLLEDNVTEEVPQATDEPTDEQTETQEETPKEDAEAPKYPEKFRAEDGSLDTDKLLEAYSSLEKGFTQKTQEFNDKLAALQNERQQQALEEVQSQGFNSIEERQFVHDVANHISDGYFAYADSTADPAYVRNMLVAYKNEPSAELLADIESYFDIDTIKSVTANSSSFAYQLKQQMDTAKQEQQYVQLQTEAKEYVQNALDTYPDWFKVPEFVALFKDALMVKGDSFDCGELVKHISNLKEVFRQEFISEQNQKKENEDYKKNVISQSPKNTKPVSTDYNALTDSELSEQIRKLV